MENPGDILLSNQYPVLEKVFSFLNAKTLCLAANVCVAWNKAKEKEIKRRKIWSTLLYHPIEQFAEINYADELTIVPSTLINLFSVRDHKRKFSCPNNCNVVSSLVPGLIGKTKDDTVCMELEEGSGVSLLSLKESGDGVNCDSFSVTAEDFKMIINKKLSFFNCININPSKNDNVVLFLMLRTMSSVRVKKLVASIRKEAVCFNLVIIGGQCPFISHNNNDVKVAGFIIYGSNLKPYLRTYKGNVEEELKNILSEMKDKSHPTDSSTNISKSLMLMVSCIGRGYSIYGKTNAECKIINQIFPSLQVFGFFGLGEIAYDSTCDMDMECALTYTSVFCYIQLK